METPPICLLHIGKTGGSYLKSVLKHNADILPSNLRLLKHNATLMGTREKLGANRKLAFIVRNPEARFISAFNSRLRQGRPSYQVSWSADEAAAFLWFETANDLAEGLASENERVKSAAIFAMHAISHVAKGYEFYLGGILELEKEKANIVVCLDIADLTPRLPEILDALGVSGAKLPDAPRHHNDPTGPTGLSEKGQQALKQYWDREYRIYEKCRKLEGIFKK